MLETASWRVHEAAQDSIVVTCGTTSTRARKGAPLRGTAAEKAIISTSLNLVARHRTLAGLSCWARASGAPRFESRFASTTPIAERSCRLDRVFAHHDVTWNADGSPTATRRSSSVPPTMTPGNPIQDAM